MAGANHLVRFENVGLRYGDEPEVLRDITFHLGSGSYHFLTGPSGAGKTSLLRLMYLAHRPSRGSVSVLGRDVAMTPRDELPGLRRRIGVIFQNFRLLDHLSAVDNVALPLRIAGAPRDVVRERAAELLTWVGLGDLLDAQPRTLPDGGKQRVAIARAVINRPSLLLADEPTGSIDHNQGNRILHLFEELNKIGTTVVLATHDRAIVERHAHPVLRLDRGTLSVRRNAGAARGGA